MNWSFFKGVLSGRLAPKINKVVTAFLPAHKRPNPILHVRKPEVRKEYVNNGETIPEGEQKILAACIQFEGGVTRQSLTVLTGYKRSTRDAYIARLRDKGFVDLNSETVFATEEGRAALPNAEPLPTGEELQNYWLAKLPEGECKIFKVLLENYPNPVDRERISELTEFKRSTRDAYISRMSAKMIVQEPSRGMVIAANQLFE